MFETINSMIILAAIYNFLVDSIQSIFLAAAVFLVVYVFLFRPFQVKGDSMYPSFYDKDQVITNLIVLKFGQLKRGDVVVFKAPPDPEKDYIKRVIGIPGDTVSLQDGFIFVNGSKLDETAYLPSDIRTEGSTFLQNGGTVTVPLDTYFVMGDNRPFSSDSREWGVVKSSLLIGKSSFVYWPLNRMKSVKNPFTD